MEADISTRGLVPQLKSEGKAWSLKAQSLLVCSKQEGLGGGKARVAVIALDSA